MKKHGELISVLKRMDLWECGQKCGYRCPHRRPAAKYVPLQHPLHQQQQHEPRQAQHADDQGVPQVQPQGDAGDAGGQAHHPQRQKAQQGVAQLLSSARKVSVC